MCIVICDIYNAFNSYVHCDIYNDMCIKHCVDILYIFVELVALADSGICGQIENGGTCGQDRADA